MPISDKTYFHIYNKGVQNIDLFADDEDYKVFLGYLQEYLSPKNSESSKKAFTVKGQVFRGIPHQPKNYFEKVELLAYSLLPDHFHLVASENTGGALMSLVRSLSTRYALYFNKKYKRQGNLFAGQFKSVKINDLVSLIFLTHYVHQESHRRFSSYQGYLGEDTATWLKPSLVLTTFKREGSYKNFIERYFLTPKEENALEAIIIENLPAYTKSFKPIKHKSEPKLKAFLYVGTSAFMFVILFAHGISNINIPSSLNTPQVAGAESVIPQTTVVITRSNTSKYINIYENATSDSIILGKAVLGDTFEYVSENDGWYQIKVGENGLGYISRQFSQIVGRK